MNQPSRFIILFSARTGSTLLSEMLGSHPGICSDGELLMQAGHAGSRDLGSLIRHRSQAETHLVYGFKASLHQLTQSGRESGEQLIGDLAAQGWHVIYLYRSDIVRQALSYVRACRTRVFHIHMSDREVMPECRIGIADMCTAMYAFIYSRRREERLVRHIPHMRINYECHLSEPAAQQSTISEICSLLGIGYTPVCADTLPLSGIYYQRGRMHDRIWEKIWRCMAVPLYPAATLSEALHYHADAVLPALHNYFRQQTLFTYSYAYRFIRSFGVIA